MLVGIITPSTAAVIILLILIYLLLIRPLFFAPLSYVPGPVWCKLSWYYIVFFDLRLERSDKIAQWHQQYGPVICIRPGEVSFSCPILMREIYGTSGKYTKSDFFDNFMTYGEKSIFSIGPYWEHQKKRMLISSFYHKTNINQASIVNSVRQQMVKLFRQIETKENGQVRSFNVYPIFNCFAFDNISRLLYGPRHCSHTLENDGEERRLLLGMKQAQVWGPLKFVLPVLTRIPQWARSILPRGLQDSLTAEHKLAVWNWARFTAAIEDIQMEDVTLLRRMLTINDKDRRPLEQNYIAAETFDHLNAAQETVAVALTYTAYHLSVQPEWQRRIREELQALSVQEDDFPSFADIDAAPLLEAFIREVHRVNPGASGRQERIVPEGGKDYDGIFLPEGIRVSASTIALHHNPSTFPAPAVFNPNRWLGLTPEQLQYLERSFIPFGYGARVCLGKAFATLELKLLTARLYLRYHTEVDPDSATATPYAMWQTGTMDSVPNGLRCDLLLHRLT